MAIVYGVTPTGFLRKPLQAILADLASTQKTTIAATLNTSTTSVLGQLNGIFARELAICWEQIEIAYHSNDPDAAEDMLLTMLCKLTGTVRRPATPSTITLTCGLLVGTTLIAGTSFASVDGRPDLRWTPKVNYGPVTDIGDYAVPFVSEHLGPIETGIGTVTVIATPTMGWTTVNNLAASTPGIVADTDATLRTNRELELAAVGSTTVRAIEAKILEAFATADSGIIQVINIFENDTDYVDGTTGNAPHSLEVLIFDGLSPSVDDDALAQVIWDNKAGGVQTVGTSSGTATIDAAGTTKTVYFTRATQVPIYLVYVIVLGDGYVGDATLKQLISDNANARFGPNQAVRAEIVKAMALPPNVGVAGVTDITTFRLGTAPSPVGTINIPIGLRQIATFDPTQITITDT